MKILAKLIDVQHPPKLSLVIFDAPHRRMHVRVIQEYRKSLQGTCEKAGIEIPIEYPIDLDVTFVNPTSCDLGNLYLALEQAIDGTTLKAIGPGLVVDDSLVSKVTMMKLYTGNTKK